MITIANPESILRKDPALAEFMAKGEKVNYTILENMACLECGDLMMCAIADISERRKAKIMFAHICINPECINSQSVIHNEESLAGMLSGETCIFCQRQKSAGTDVQF